MGWELAARSAPRRWQAARQDDACQATACQDNACQDTAWQARRPPGANPRLRSGYATSPRVAQPEPGRGNASEEANRHNRLGVGQIWAAASIRKSVRAGGPGLPGRFLRGGQTLASEPVDRLPHAQPELLAQLQDRGPDVRFQIQCRTHPISVPEPRPRSPRDPVVPIRPIREHVGATGILRSSRATAPAQLTREARQFPANLRSPRYVHRPRHVARRPDRHRHQRRRRLDLRDRHGDCELPVRR